ncbi:MAG: nitroreductase/quinone reductase family protein [Haloplanus sp.]
MDDGTHGSASPRVGPVQRTLERRVANPLARSVLRSRVHWVVSDWFVLVSYVGRRSGRRYTFPVAYHRLDGAIVVATPKRESNWWRNFREPRSCRVWLRGDARAATGEVVTGDERGALLAAYVERHPRLGRLLGVDAALVARPDRLAESSRDVAVVRFVLDAR